MEVYDSVYFIKGKDNGSRVASFDMDSTLVKTKSGKPVALYEDDWIWIDPAIPQYLAGISKDWTIAIFTNQGVRNKPMAINRVRKIVNSLNLAGAHPYVYISTMRDNYRKPATGMWNLFLSHFNKMPVSGSFYSGDGEGESSIYPEYRWSDSDKKFAENIGLPYFNPMVVFYGQR